MQQLVKEVQEKTKGREELLSEVVRVAQSAEKDKGKEMEFEKPCKEFEKEIETLCLVEEDAPNQRKRER
uniref:Protein MNN4-like n=1 Tax=Cucumis melo TaxID=3656 RepID=A0A9I9D4P3_CUCME